MNTGSPFFKGTEWLLKEATIKASDKVNDVILSIGEESPEQKKIKKEGEKIAKTLNNLSDKPDEKELTKAGEKIAKSIMKIEEGREQTSRGDIIYGISGKLGTTIAYHAGFIEFEDIPKEYFRER